MILPLTANHATDITPRDDGGGPDAVAETILTAPGRDGLTYAMVAFVGGDIGVAREGLPVPGHRWAAGEMKECADALVRLAGLDRDPPVR